MKVVLLSKVLNQFCMANALQFVVTYLRHGNQQSYEVGAHRFSQLGEEEK